MSRTDFHRPTLFIATESVLWALIRLMFRVEPVLEL